MNRILLIAAVGLSLASCETRVEPDPNGTEAERFEARVQAGDPVAVEQRITQDVSEHLTWTDPVTGCDYVAPGQSSSYGSMPRVDRDGLHAYCAEQKERDRREAEGLAPVEAPAAE